MIVRLERQGAAVLETPVEELRQHVRDAASAHIDETSWWQERVKAWLWTAVTDLVTVFTIATSRRWGRSRPRTCWGRRRARWSSVIGSRAMRGSSAASFAGRIWNRDFQAMVDRGGESAEVGRRLVEPLRAFVRLVASGAGRDDGPSHFQSKVAIMRFSFRDDLRLGLTCGHSKTAGTCRELLAGETHLWTFVRVEGIEPTNNDAERALRHGVIYRKTSGGMDSESGSRFVERILSVVAICRQQDINVLDYLTRCYQAHLDGTPTPSLLPPATTTQAT